MWLSRARPHPHFLEAAGSDQTGPQFVGRIRSRPKVLLSVDQIGREVEAVEVRRQPRRGIQLARAVAPVRIVEIGVRGQHGAAQFHGHIDRGPDLAQAFLLASAQMKIICKNGLGAYVHRSNLAEELGVRGGAAAGFPRRADFDQSSSDRAAYGPFYEGHPLVVDEHHARERSHRRAVVDAVLD